LATDTTARGFALRDGLVEVELAVAKEVAQQAHVPMGVAEAVGDGLGREPIDEGGAESLIAPLPVVSGTNKEGGIVHGKYYTI
jgi:hypothetical protein